MQWMVPKEIQEAHKKIGPWLLFSEEKGYSLREDAPDEIKKLEKKMFEWWKKHPTLMD